MALRHAIAPENPGAVTPQKEPYTVAFQRDTLRRVVDSPLICGEHFRSIDIAGKGTPPVTLHLVSESPAAIAIDDKLIAQYRALVREALALFGGAHFSEYHFLVVCSDRVPNNGLEHLSCSFNAVGERDLIDDKKRKDWPAYLLPHEFVHSWCGKFRRPAAMLTTNFHSPERTRLLWIYEGLTQYLGEVLTVRSGLLTPEEYVPKLASTIDFLRNQNGPALAVARGHGHREPGNSAARALRGLRFVAARIITTKAWSSGSKQTRSFARRAANSRSLDDFCRKFFAVKPGEAVVAPYELAEVTGILKQLADHDWEAFFRDRVSAPKETLGLSFLETLGYRVQYSPKPSEYLTEREKERKFVTATASLGLSINEDGKIATVVPESLADKAGLAGGMTVTGVNGRKFSSQRLKDGIADSPTRGKVELLVLDGEVFKTIALPYAEGPKYLELTRLAGRQDLLGAIGKPVAPAEKKSE